MKPLPLHLPCRGPHPVRLRVLVCDDGPRFVCARALNRRAELGCAAHDDLHRRLLLPQCHRLWRPLPVDGPAADRRGRVGECMDGPPMCRGGRDRRRCGGRTLAWGGVGVSIGSRYIVWKIPTDTVVTATAKSITTCSASPLTVEVGPSAGGARCARRHVDGECECSLRRLLVAA